MPKIRCHSLTTTDQLRVPLTDYVMWRGDVEDPSWIWKWTRAKSDDYYDKGRKMNVHIYEPKSTYSPKYHSTSGGREKASRS